jgi:hypothetical protein
MGAFRATEASDGDNDQLAWQAEFAYTFAASLPLACVGEPRPPSAPAGDDAIYIYFTVVNECVSVTSGHHIPS